MTINKRPRIRNPEAVEDARKLIQAGADIELVLLFFRDHGFDMADCIYAVQDVFAKQFAVAKGLVIRSQAWAHKYESDAQLRDAARNALKQLADSNSPDLPRIVFEDENE
ncbi:MAG TPA: hypothetical protein VJN89_22560 [Candidatus Acidoferrum sp.]|nr:hypothetical protein [Candidatus Acidoferrum sp.]